MLRRALPLGGAFALFVSACNAVLGIDDGTLASPDGGQNVQPGQDGAKADDTSPRDSGLEDRTVSPPDGGSDGSTTTDGANDGQEPYCASQPNGTPCNGDNAHVCYNGQCVACTSGGSCTPSNACHEGRFSCSTGQQVCVDQGTNKPNDTACGSGMYCESGSCVACSPAPGTTCTPANVCHVGAQICTTSGASCSDTGMAPNGTLCGAADECFNGACSSCAALATSWPQSNGWSAVSTNGPARYDHAMAYDPVHHRSIVFGGYPVLGSNGDNGTFTWDGSTWTTQSLTNPPPSRAYTSMAFDSFHVRLVMFGGMVGTTTVLGDTWTWDGSSTSWTQVSCSVGCPAARDVAGMAYDSDQHVVIMFGGQTSVTGNGSPIADTWQFDAGTGTWTNRLPANSPPASGFVSMVYDSVRRVMVAVAPGWPYVWEYDYVQNTWTQRTSSASGPGARQQPALAFDPSAKRTVLFGGCTAPCGAGDYRNDRWEWDGTCWRNTTNASKSPPALQGMTMTYDTDHSKLVIFGGATASISATTWQ